MTTHLKRVIPKTPKTNFYALPSFRKRNVDTYSHHIPKIPVIPEIPQDFDVRIFTMTNFVREHETTLKRCTSSSVRLATRRLAWQVLQQIRTVEGVRELIREPNQKKL